MAEVLVIPCVISLLAAIACGVVGTITVIRGNTYIAGAVSHSALAGIGLAEFAGFSPDAGALAAVCVVSMILALYGGNKDSLLSAVWSVGMGAGLLFLCLSPGRQTGLMDYLFGSMAVATMSDVWMLLAADAAVLLLIFIFRHGIISVCFNIKLCRASGAPVLLYEIVISFATALTVFVLSKAVGIVLVIALLALPSMSALIISRKMGPTMILSGVFAFVSLAVGIAVSWHWEEISISPPAVICSAVLLLTAKLCRKLTKSARVPPAM